MRILVVHPGPNFSVSDVHDGWVEALRGLGNEVASFNLDDRLQFYCSALIDTGDRDPMGNPLVRTAMSRQEALRVAMQGISHACFSMWPDVVIVISGFFMTAGMLELIRSRRMKTVLMCTESPYQEEMQLERALAADITLLNDPTNLYRYEDLTTVEYMPHAYRPSIHYPRPAGEPRDAELAADLAFIGTGFQSRIEFFESMDLKGLDVMLGGNWIDAHPDGKLPEDSPLKGFFGHDPGECVANDEAARVYRNAKCGINFYRREAEEGCTEQGWAMGPREVEQAACGMFFLRDPRPEGDQVLNMLPTFASPEDASEQLRWWLAHEDERETAAEKAREAVADRTFENNARRLMKLLDDL